MSITLDVNAFLNNTDICSQSGCNSGTENVHGKEMQIDDLSSLEKEMESSGSIFDEIEHLLKFNKNLEFPEPPKIPKPMAPNKFKTTEDPNQTNNTFNLDFLSAHTEDFLLTSDTQSLLGEDPLLFCVEQDRLQPLSSKFMVPGIYKRIEGVDRIHNCKNKVLIANVFITNLEKTGRIIREADFQRLYVMEKHLTTKIEEIKETLMESIESKEKTENIAVNISKINNNNSSVNFPRPEETPFQWDALNRLACDVLKLRSRDHIVIDRKRNEIIKTEYGTNQKTIYCLSQPELLDLNPPDFNNNLSQQGAITKDIKTPVHKTKKPAKKKMAIKKPNKFFENKDNKDKVNAIVAKQIEISTPINQNHTRTRSGRSVKMPITTETIYTNGSPSSPKETLAEILLDLKDVSYHIKSNVKRQKLPNNHTSLPQNETAEIQPPLEIKDTNPPKRKVPPEAICPTCHKIFLGKRLQKHFAQHPDHIKVPIINNDNNNKTLETMTISQEHHTDLNQNPTNTTDNSSSQEDISLFRFLVNKLQRSQHLNEDQKADLFLNELNDLMEQLHVRSSRLIRNTSGLHLVNQKCAKLLGIPEGQYALDLSAIEGPLEPEMQDTNQVNQQNSSTNHLNSRCLDITNLSITLDDTLTDEAAQKLNLSAGGKLLPPSEESLLRAVGDLVQTDITKLQNRTNCVNDTAASNKSSSNVVVANLLPPHIDHVSDNAVEAGHMKETSLPNVVVNGGQNPLLDLSVDFFQFNN